MKTKNLSVNRVTRSHTASANQATRSARRLPESGAAHATNNGGAGDQSVVSNRDKGAILRQVEEIRQSWTQAERRERAEMGAQRRAELCQLLFGAN